MTPIKDWNETNLYENLHNFERLHCQNNLIPVINERKYLKI